MKNFKLPPLEINPPGYSSREPSNSPTKSTTSPTKSPTKRAPSSIEVGELTKMIASIVKNGEFNATEKEMLDLISKSSVHGHLSLERFKPQDLINLYRSLPPSAIKAIQGVKFNSVTLPAGTYHNTGSSIRDLFRRCMDVRFQEIKNPFLPPIDNKAPTEKANSEFALILKAMKRREL